MPLSPHIAAVILFTPRPRKDRRTQAVRAEVIPFPLLDRHSD